VPIRPTTPVFKPAAVSVGVAGVPDPVQRHHHPHVDELMMTATSIS